MGMVYSINKKIEGNEALTQLFNTILGEMNFLRMVTAPSSTFSFKHNSNMTAQTFFDCCIVETYFHRVIDELRKWSADTYRYVNEFNCSWKYFALSEKNDLIDKYGYDESDYDDKGKLKTSYTDDELSHYTLPSSWTGYNDIFLTSEPSDFEFAHKVLENVSMFSFSKFKSAMGLESLPTYKNENGEMKPMSWEEEIIDDAHNQYRADSLSEILKWVLNQVRELVDDVLRLIPTKDNKEFFQSLNKRIDNILKLEIPIN